VVALVGESGCGKTTLGKAAIGLQRPTRGRITYRGQDIWEAKDNPGSADVEWNEIRNALQIIHQDPDSSLNSTRTVLSSLMDPLKETRPDLSPHECEENIYQLLDFVGMSPPQDYAHRYPHQLSGGEKQRVALVRALLMNPELIFADEAISALDVSLRLEMMDIMLELQDVFNTSYLFVSHDLANARYLAERADGLIGIMYSGQLVEIGTPQQILTNPRHPYTKVLRWSIPPLHPQEAKEGIHDDPPVRQIDIPDPEDLPTGCNFHPRCEQAREVCAREEPDLIEDDGTRAACFRQDETHEYWDSASLVEE
jgi:peptide/nickel transport system ATP-binding protein